MRHVMKTTEIIIFGCEEQVSAVLFANNNAREWQRSRLYSFVFLITLRRILSRSASTVVVLTYQVRNTKRAT